MKIWSFKIKSGLEDDPSLQLLNARLSRYLKKDTLRVRADSERQARKLATEEFPVLIPQRDVNKPVLVPSEEMMYPIMSARLFECHYQGDDLIEKEEVIILTRPPQ